MIPLIIPSSHLRTTVFSELRQGAVIGWGWSGVQNDGSYSAQVTVCGIMAWWPRCVSYGTKFPFLLCAPLPLKLGILPLLLLLTLCFITRCMKFTGADPFRRFAAVSKCFCFNKFFIVKLKKRFEGVFLRMIRS